MKHLAHVTKTPALAVGPGVVVKGTRYQEMGDIVDLLSNILFGWWVAKPEAQA